MRRHPRAAWVWACYLAAGLAVSVISLELTDPYAAATLHSLLGMTAAVAALAGVAWHRPRPRRWWLLFAVGVFAFACGDIASTVQQLHGRLPAFSAADVLHFAAAPLMAVALLGFASGRMNSLRVARMLLVDSAAVFVAAFTVLWFFRLDALLDFIGVPANVQVLSVASPALDVAMLALAARLVLTTGFRLTACRLVTLGVLAGFGGDLLWRGSPTVGSTTLSTASYCLMYVLAGAAALHPSMRELSQVKAPDRAGFRLRRLAMLAAASLVLPLIVITHGGDLGTPRNVLVFALAATLIPLLAIHRLTDVVAVAHDALLERERAEIEQRVVQESEQRLQALVQNGSDMITVVAPDTTILYVAGSVRSVLGYEPEELEGRKLSAWVDPDDVRALMELCTTRQPGGAELRLRHRDDSLRTCEARAASLLDDPAWKGIVLNVWDVSDRKLLEQRLHHQAFHDALTGLPNRALFADRLAHALARGRRSSGEIAVLLIDLDDFKSINDSLGHARGDQLLVEVGTRLRAAVRAADTAARLGGDEFAVILEDGESAADAERSAERILTALGEPVKLGDRMFPLAASVGVARAPAGTADADGLMRDADVAMYTAKAAGKNRHAVFEPAMRLAIQDRLELKADLLRAVEAGDELEVYYQPIVLLATGEIVGLEALLRWHHRTRGLLEASRFVPLAEESGTIVQIGRWVLEQACHQARAWLDEYDRPLSVSVNVSARQLETPALVDDVGDALRSSGLPADCLVLELTETELMRDLDHAVAALRTLKQLGVRIAIDDFGSGYSSLGQLERLPIDILKVERDFGGTLHDPGKHAGLIQAVMAIGQSLHLTTVAECIETPEQLRQLQSLDCPLGQGFLFSRPLPAPAIDALLAPGAGKPPPRAGAAGRGMSS